MAQLVGKDCTRCGGRIGLEVEGAFCPGCSAPVHRACIAPTPDHPNTCATCGTSEERAPREGPPRPELPTPERVRLDGLYWVGGGAAFWFIGSGYAVRGIPAPWFGIVAMAVGLWQILFAHRPSVRASAGRSMAVDEGERPRADALPPRRVTCEGTFDTPVFAIRTQPFPVTGRGSLAVSPRGLEVSAFRVVTTLRSLGLLAAASLVVGGGCMLALAPELVWIVPVLGGTALWVPFSRMKAAEGEPVRMRILWPSVASFREDEEGRVVIVVENAKPRGEIRFAPDGAAGPLLRALCGEG